MDEIKIQDLIERCVSYFQVNCYTENRLSKYKSLWRTGIIHFMSAKGIENYTAAIGAEFIETCHYHGTVRPQEREKIRSVQVLDDMLILGRIRKRCFTPVFHALEGEMGHEMEKLVTHMANLRRSKTTVNDYRLYLSEFLHHLTASGVHHISEIAEQHILSFVSSHPTNKMNIVSALRVLFRFWKEEHILDGRFGDLFDTYKVRQKERIPSFYTSEEVMRVENSISRSSGVGKRNYAMVLLASRLGLRASDIAGLQFGDIDWDKNIITLKMQKTQKVIELPLLAEVGNAIIDYLRHGRPKSILQSVFLSSRAPYVIATKAMVCAAINNTIFQSGIDTGGKHHGPHSLRHSLANAMLDDGIMLPVISEVLGHRSTQTTLTYLKIDIRSLLSAHFPYRSSRMISICREEVLSMAELFNYSSVLAPHMKHLIQMKASAGISAQRVKWILKEFDDFANAQKLMDSHITEEFICKWRKTREADCDKTLYAKYSVWSQLTTMMSRNGCVCFIPRLPKQPKPNFTPYIFTHEQIASIFAAADEYRLYDIRMGTSLMAMPAILRLLYSTGVRISEALSIRNEDVHLNEHHILLHKTKNGSVRIVPVCESLETVLTKYVTYRNRMPIKGIDDAKHLFFVKSDGTSFQANAVYQHFKKLLDKCGIPHIGNHHGPRVHDLRHSSAVHAMVQMGRSGMDLYTSLPILSTSLGHHSLSATEQYVRLTCSMYPELEEQCSPINAFVYPKVCKAYDYDD